MSEDRRKKALELVTSSGNTAAVKQTGSAANSTSQSVDRRTKALDLVTSSGNTAAVKQTGSAANSTSQSVDRRTKALDLLGAQTSVKESDSSKTWEEMVADYYDNPEKYNKPSTIYTGTEKSGSFLSRLKDTFSGGIKGTLSNISDAFRTLYESGQKRRDTESNDQLAQYKTDYDRAYRAYQEDLEAYGADSPDVKSDLYILEDLKKKIDAFDYVAENNVQKKAADATGVLSDQISQSANIDLNRAKSGLGFWGQTAVDVGANVVQMAGDTVFGALTGTGATGSMLGMGVRSFGGGTQEARKSGATLGQQIGYGTASAAVELLTEKLSDGLAGIYGKGAADEITEAIIGKLGKNAMGRTALRALTNMAGEGGEEFISTLVNPLIKGIYDNGDAMKTSYGTREGRIQLLSDAGYDALVGALVGGTVGGVGGVITGDNYRSNRDLRNADSTIKEAGSARTVDNYLKALRGETISASQIASSAVAVEGVISKLGLNSRAADIIRSGLELGKADEQAYARGVEEAFNYGKLGAPVDAMTEGGTFVQALTAQQRQNAYNLGRLSAGKSVQETANTTTPPQTEMRTEPQNASENVAEKAAETALEPKTAANGFNTETAAENPSIDSTVSEQFADAGKTSTSLESPKMGQAAESKTIADYAGKYGEASQKVVDAYNETPDAELVEFETQFSEAYNVGYSGGDARDLSSIDGLTDSQKQTAYEIGAAAGESDAQKSEADVKAKGKAGKKINKKGVAKVIDVEDMKVSAQEIRKSFNDPQNVVYRFASKLAQVTGVDVIFFKPRVDENGNFIDDYGGFVVKGGKHEFMTQENAIYVNIYAGLDNVNDVNTASKYILLRTFTHEFTHFIEKWSPAQYRELRKSVFKQMAENGQSARELIKTQMDNFPDLTYDKASREVVAEAMVDMLDQSDIVQQLAQENPTLYKSVLNKLSDYVARIKTYFKSIVPNNSAEAQAVKSNLKYGEDLVKLWTEAGKSAAKNYKAATGEEVSQTKTSPKVKKETGKESEKKTPKQVTGKLENLQNELVSEASEAKTEEPSQVKPAEEEVPAEVEEEGTVAEIIEAAEAEKITEDVPPTAETEAAKQKIKREIKKSIRFPVETANDVALETALKNKELAIDNVTLPGNVDGFNKEQRAYIVENLIEGYYSDKDVINLKVPFDGKFSIKNDINNVLYILKAMKANVNQEIEFSKKLLQVLDTKTNQVSVIKYNGEFYATNGYIIMPVSEGAYNYGVENSAKGVDGILFRESSEAVAKSVVDRNYEPVTVAPVEVVGKYGKKEVTYYRFDTSTGYAYFNAKYVKYLDSDSFLISEWNPNGKEALYMLKSLDAEGNVVGYALSMKTSSIPEKLNGTVKPSKLNAFAGKNKRSTKNGVAPSTAEATAANEAPTVPAEPARKKAPAKKSEAAADKKADKSKPQIVETTEKLEDFGEKIGGARKDWRSEGLYSYDLEDMNERERKSNVKKDNVWKRPDYKKLIASGVSRGVLFARNELRKSLNANINYRSSWDEDTVKQKQKSFIDTIRAIQELTEKATSKADFENMVTWLYENGYMDEKGGTLGVNTTNKWRSNPALFASNYYQTLKNIIRNYDKLERLADSKNFAVEKDAQIPAGFRIVQNSGENSTWYVAKGHWIVRDNFASYEEALKYLQDAQRKKTNKTRFVPEQLLAVHRKGPDYRGGKSVDGQAYIDTFGFKGGEYGNWMTQKDRQASLDYGYDAFMDLADALGVPPTDISFGGNLSIAFGARGQGLSGAAAHYEPMRHVINLTKMNGAGSLAHEWFHALDDFTGGYTDSFATFRYYKLPERTKTAITGLIQAMKYKDQTAAEADLSKQHTIERTVSRVNYELSTWFRWADKMKNGTLTDADTQYFNRKPTEEDVTKFDAMKERILNGDISAIDELSALKKDVTGHVIEKENREYLRNCLWGLTPEARSKTVVGRKSTQFYSDSQLFDNYHSKDGDYWSSTIEMAARAFACYITDKTGKNNDYLSAHSESAKDLVEEANGNFKIIYAFPRDEERAATNKAFDNLIEALKADGFLHQAEESEKPAEISYSRKKISPDMSDEERYNVLKDKTISINAKTDTTKLSEYQRKNNVVLDPIPRLVTSQRKKLFQKIGEEFNVFREYRNNDIELSFNYSTSNLHESLNKQGKNYGNFAKLLSCFEDVVDSAVGIEVHNRNAQGYKIDPTLSNVYVLVSAFEDGNSIIPVKLEVKEFADKPNTLYVAISLESIKKDEVYMQGNTENGVTQYTRSSVIKLADLLSNVNPKDESFTKYIPEQFFKSGETQYSRRSPVLSNREVLELAADEMLTGTVTDKKGSSQPKYNLTEGQRYALNLFKERLDKLRDLQAQRTEAGRIYQEQMFTKGGSRADAAATKSRMDILDSKITALSNALLSMEEKDVLRQVLVEARKVVETAERAESKRQYDNRRQNESNKLMISKISGVVDNLNNMLLKGGKDKHVLIGLQKVVAEALDAINMDTLGAADRLAALQKQIRTEKDPEKLQALIDKYARLSARNYKMSEKLRELKTEYDAIKDSDDPLIANAHDEVISSMIDGTIRLVGDTAIADMNGAQLKAVYDMYKSILTYVRDANKAFVAEKGRAITELASDVIAETEAANRLTNRGKDRLTLLDVVERTGWKVLKPVYAFKAIGSKTLTGLFNNIRAGEDTWAIDITGARSFFLETSKKYGYNEWDMNETHKFTSSSGMDFELTLPQIMSLYAYSRRNKNMEHLIKGGIVLDQRGDIVKKSNIPFLTWTATDATAYNLSYDTLVEIAGILTKEQTDFAEEMQTYLSDVMGEKGNEVSLKMYGIKLFGEKNYFPLKSATQYMAKAKEQQKKGMDGGVKIKNSGFTKDLKEGASNPIVLENFMDVWSEHVNDMSMYHGFVLPLEDFGRVFGYNTKRDTVEATKSVEATIQNAYGKGAVEYIDNLLRDLNGGARTDPTAGIMNRLISGFKKGAVFANMSVVIQQYSAITRAWAYVDPKFFVMKKMDAQRHDAAWEEVKKYAPVAIIKDMGFFDTSVGRSTSNYIQANEYEGFEEKSKAFFTDKNYRDEVYGKLPSLMDELAWCRIWEACKLEIFTRQGLRGEDLLKAAGERFTEVIVNTQVYDSVLSRCEMMRSKDTGMKMTTAFMAEPITTINMLWNSIVEGNRTGKSVTAKTFGACAASLIFNSILVSFVYAARDDDDDDSYWEKYVKSFFGDIHEGINPLTYLPFASDIVSIFKGYEVQRSDMSIVSEIYKGWKKLKRTDVPVWNKIEDFVGGICKIFGVPLKNVMRDVRSIYQTVNSFQNPTTAMGMANAVKEGWTGEETPRAEQLYGAIVAGDKIQEQRIRGQYSSDKAADTAFKSAIKSKFLDEKLTAEEAMLMLKKYVLAKDSNDAYFIVRGWKTDEGIYDAVYKAVDSNNMSNYTAAVKDLTTHGVEKDEVTSRVVSRVRDNFLESGTITAAQAKTRLTRFGGKTAEESDKLVSAWQFKKSNPSVDWEKATIAKYKSEAEPAGISVKVFDTYLTGKAECEGTDNDHNGKTDTGSVKREVMDVINALPISPEQKDALYYAAGYAASTIGEAPWH